MTLEAQLEKLKKEIVEKHRDVVGESVNPDENASKALELYMLEYEQLSAEYNELFTQILEDSVKMKDEYTSIKKA
jgi:hypothetical protein